VKYFGEPPHNTNALYLSKGKLLRELQIFIGFTFEIFKFNCVFQTVVPSLCAAWSIVSQLSETVGNGSKTFYTMKEPISDRRVRDIRQV